MGAELPKRFWCVWWSSNYEEDGCKEPSFQAWETAKREKDDKRRLCALVDAMNADTIKNYLLQCFPDCEIESIERRTMNFTPTDYFENFQGRTTMPAPDLVENHFDMAHENAFLAPIADALINSQNLHDWRTSKTFKPGTSGIENSFFFLKNSNFPDFYMTIEALKTRINLIIRITEAEHVAEFINRFGKQNIAVLNAPGRQYVAISSMADIRSRTLIRHDGSLHQNEINTVVNLIRKNIESIDNAFNQ